MKWRAWRFLEVARREGNTKSVRKAIVRSSAWNRRGKKLHETSVDRALLTRVTVSRIGDRCHYRAWIHFARPDLFAEMTRNREEDDRHDAARHGTAARLLKRRNDSSTRSEKIRSTIDRLRIFFFYDHATTYLRDVCLATTPCIHSGRVHDTPPYVLTFVRTELAKARSTEENGEKSKRNRERTDTRSHLCACSFVYTLETNWKRKGGKGE